MSAENLRNSLNKSTVNRMEIFERFRVMPNMDLKVNQSEKGSKTI